MRKYYHIKRSLVSMSANPTTSFTNTFNIPSKFIFTQSTFENRIQNQPDKA